MPVGEWRPSHRRDLYESPSGIIGHRGPNANTKKWYNHMPADLVRQSIHEDTWNNYFKFCTIRDPFEKCISGFVWHGKKFRNSGKNFNSSKYLNMNVFWRDAFLEYLIEEALITLSTVAFTPSMVNYVWIFLFVLNFAG